MDRIVNVCRARYRNASGIGCSTIVRDEIACTGAGSTDNIARADDQHAAARVAQRHFAGHIGADDVALGGAVLSAEEGQSDAAAAAVAGDNVARRLAWDGSHATNEDAGGRASAQVHAAIAVRHGLGASDIGANKIALYGVATSRDEKAGVAVSRNDVASRGGSTADLVVHAAPTDTNSGIVSNGISSRDISADKVSFDNYERTGNVQAVAAVSGDDVSSATYGAADRDRIGSIIMHSTVADQEPDCPGVIRTDEVTLNQGASGRRTVFDAIASYPNHVAGGRAGAADSVVSSLDANAEVGASVARGNNRGTARVGAEKIAANQVSAAGRDEDLFVESSDGQPAHDAVAGSDGQSRKQVLGTFYGRAAQRDSDNRVVAVSQRVGARAWLSVAVDSHGTTDCRKHCLRRNRADMSGTTAIGISPWNTKGYRGTRGGVRT